MEKGATRRKIRKAVFPAAGLGTRFLPATKAQPKEMLPLVDKPIIQYVIEEAVAAGLTNIIIVTGRGKNAIEDHFDVSSELEAFLERRGKLEQLEEIRKISNQPIRYVVNTHYHGDHSGGNPKMQAQNVQVVASERARRKMVEVNQPGAPNVTLENNLRLYLGGKRVELYHFGRAHTDGDVVAYFPEQRVVAMGDMFTIGDGLPPLVDYPGGGSTREWPRSIEGTRDWRTP